MRLSEAILLGSTMVKPKAGALHFSGENSGCALGMAVIASGGTVRRSEHPLPVTERRTLNVEDLWGAWLLLRIARPCDCGVPIFLSRLHRNKIPTYQRRHAIFALPREMRTKDIITHLFDYHVMVKGDWNLDRLAAWLRPLEPNDSVESSTISGRVSPKANVIREDAEWLKTRQSFEAQIKAKRHPRITFK
jgi:hypothetical protein